MTDHIRPFAFTDDDYRRVVALRNRLYPDIQSTVEIWKNNDETRRQEPSYRFFVAENGSGDLLGFAQTAKLNPQSETFSLGLICQPAAWESGAADGLLAAVKQTAAEQGGRTVVQKVQASDTGKLAFLTGRGFRPIMRYRQSALDVAAFDAAPFQAQLARTAAAGITIQQVPAGWEHDPAQQRFMHALDWQMMLDVPHHEARMQKSLETFLKEEVHHLNAFPESYFVAWHGDEAVGLTNFVKQGGKTNTVSTALTGVARSHRRKGVATALKVYSIEFAKTVGCQTILTKNEENNRMFLINQRLGFTTRAAWVDMGLTL